MDDEEFAFGSVGPEDSDSDEVAFIPKQVSPEQDLKNKVELTNQAGLRKIMSVVDVMENDEKLSFVVEDLLPDTGLMFVAGASGTGKTILAIQIAGDLVNGNSTMSWRLGPAWNEDFRVLFLSLEMNMKELQLRLQHMYPQMSDDQRKSFMDRFLTYCDYEPFELWNPIHILDLIKLIKAYKVNTILIDSASVSFASTLKDDKQVNESIKHLYMLRARFNLSMIVVAHTRKPSIEMVNNPESASLHELFGHSGVAQSASSILIMLEDEDQRKKTIKSGEPDSIEKRVHVVNAKARFGANSGAFVSYLTSKKNVDNGEPLMFRRNAIPIAMTDDQKKKVNQELKTGGIAGALEGIDFGFLDGDE